MPQDPQAFIVCPKCRVRFEPFMRGQVTRSKRPWWDPLRLLRLVPARPHYALICRNCKEVVGWEGD